MLGGMDRAHLFALAAESLAAAGALGGLLYLLVSFFALRRHADVRSWRRLAGSFLHEALAVAVSQPLLPLFYVLGRRMGGDPRGRLESIPACAARLGVFIEHVSAETGQSKVAIVAHSLGGVVALEYLGTPEGAARVDRCVTIASPHAGVTWRGGMVGHAARQLYAQSRYMQSRASGALPVRVVSLFSTHDNIVHPAKTSALINRGGRDVVVDNLGHLSMLFSRKVADLTIDGLR